GKGAGLACQGWPLCNGQVFPGGDRLADIHAFHRLAAAAAGVLVAVFLWQALTRQRHVRPVVIGAGAVVVVFVLQVFVGAGQIWLHLNEQIRVAHLGTAALVWGALVATTALAFHSARARPDGEGEVEAGGRSQPHERAGARETVGAYVSLTKPRII